MFVKYRAYFGGIDILWDDKGQNFSVVLRL